MSVDELVKTVVREQLDLPSDARLVDSAELVADLGLDSLRALFLFVELERRIGVDLSQVEQVPRTVGELVELCASATS